MEQGIVKWSYHGNEVRTIDVDGSTRWVVKDVCAALAIKQTTRAVKGLDDDEKGVTTVHTPSGNQEMLVVTESGLYSLILRSRKQEAIAFKRWITHEVLPAIRRTGSYNQTSLTAEGAQVLISTIREQERAMSDLRHENQKFRHALYHCAPDNSHFGTEGAGGNLRVNNVRSHWKSHPNRNYITDEQRDAIQTLLPLFASPEFIPQHAIGY